LALPFPKQRVKNVSDAGKFFLMWGKTSILAPAGAAALL
jgi:hypothetical protein